MSLPNGLPSCNFRGLRLARRLALLRAEVALEDAPANLSRDLAAIPDAAIDRARHRFDPEPYLALIR
jgi:hypothetical protein